jgi:hypothetical protein
VVVAGGWGEDGDLATAAILPGQGDGNSGHISCGTWFDLPPLGIARRGCRGVALRDGRVMVIGGVAGKSNEAEYFATVESYWVAERAFGGTVGWKEIASMRQARANFGACVTDDGCVVVVGGICRPAGAMGDTTLNTAERFDVRMARWSALPPMHEARQGCSCSAITGGRVAVVGGKGLQSCELLEWHGTGRGSPQAAWVRLPPLRVERGFAASTSWQPDHVPGHGSPATEQLIVMGGQDSYWSVHKDGERLQIGPGGLFGGDGDVSANSESSCTAEQGTAWDSPAWLQPLPEARKWTAMVTASLAW